MNTAEVFLWNSKIGTVTYDESKGYGFFEYDKAFLSSGIEVSPVTMPLSSRVYSFPELNKNSFHGLPGLLSDSLPDKFGNAIIDAWLRREGRTPDSFNAVERLCYTGKRGMGALEYVPVLGPDPTKSERIELDGLVILASDILKSREQFQTNAEDGAMQQILTVGTSAGGARAKAVIAWNEETGDIRSGQVDAGKGYGHWIIKFDGVSGNGDKEGDDPHEYTRIEYAYYLMATDAGIHMKECRLYDENGRFHFMTRRFDRNEETGDKIHVQTLGALAHFDYNVPGIYGYEQGAEIMRRLKLPASDISQYFRRMVFNVLARNQDDHVKNISFLMDRNGVWRLSPAYDVTYSYNPEGIWTGTHQMTVNGKRDNITYTDLLESSAQMGLKKTEAETIIDQVSDSLCRWKEFAGNAGVSDKNRKKIEKTFIRF